MKKEIDEELQLNLEAFAKEIIDQFNSVYQDPLKKLLLNIFIEDVQEKFGKMNWDLLEKIFNKVFNK